MYRSLLLFHLLVYRGLGELYTYLYRSLCTVNGLDENALDLVIDLDLVSLLSFLDGMTFNCFVLIVPMNNTNNN